LLANENKTQEAPVVEIRFEKKLIFEKKNALLA